jgi:hypothetical protein
LLLTWLLRSKTFECSMVLTLLAADLAAALEKV